MDEAEPLTEFDECAFTSIVDKIIADKDKKLRFRLTGGLELSEFIGEAGGAGD